MTSPTNAYRTSQVLTASPAERIVLLYQGAIRFARQQVDLLARGERAEAHAASLRAQEIVAALREHLDLTAGPVAAGLDSIYGFCLTRLIDGNVHGDARPVEEAIGVLQDLLGAWQQVAAGSRETTPVQAGEPASASPLAAAPVEAAPTVAGPVRVGVRGVAAYAVLAR
jgi:flagellar protein FliS